MTQQQLFNYYMATSLVVRNQEKHYIICSYNMMLHTNYSNYIYMHSINHPPPTNHVLLMTRLCSAKKDEINLNNYINKVNLSIVQLIRVYIFVQEG